MPGRGTEGNLSYRRHPEYRGLPGVAQVWPVTKVLTMLERLSILVPMNILSLARRTAIVKALVEGNSVRATARLTGTSKNTVLRLLVDLGELCSIYQDHVLTNLQCERVQCDEIWSFVGIKQKHLPGHERYKGRGDVWTYTALCADTKLMLSWLVGHRNVKNTNLFMRDVKSRLAKRVQLTTDGLYLYPQAVEKAFGWQKADYAKLIKIYGKDESAERTYSPAVCIGIETEVVMGNPNPEHISTSFVERSNLTMRMGMRRFTRLTNAFSKKMENHAHAVALHAFHYNFIRPHTTLTKSHPLRYPTTPAMAAGKADHIWTVEELCGLLDPQRLLQ